MRGTIVTSLILPLLCVAPPLRAQQTQAPPQPGTIASNPNTPDESKPPEPEKKRLFGIVPNYRTYPLLAKYQPLTTKEKFRIATQDSFDRGTIVLAAVVAGYGQLTNQSPSFGQGVAGYARYLGTSYADFVIGDYMTEAIYPSLLHQDPRYFRKGTGSVKSRLLYSFNQIFVTHNDHGRMVFNGSEIFGNATAVAISNAYYPDNRNAPDALKTLGIQLGVDAGSNILKEFSPDIYRKLSRKHK